MMRHNLLLLLLIRRATPQTKLLKPKMTAEKKKKRQIDYHFNSNKLLISVPVMNCTVAVAGGPRRWERGEGKQTFFCAVFSVSRREWRKNSRRRRMMHSLENNTFFIFLYCAAARGQAVGTEWDCCNRQKAVTLNGQKTRSGSESGYFSGNALLHTSNSREKRWPRGC